MRWVVGGEPGEAVDLDWAYRVPQQAAIEVGRCFIRANFATSVDGLVEAGGVSKGVSSEVDRQVFHLMRGLADVILVGAQTVRSEGYGPARPTPETIERRIEQGFAPVPPIAVVTRSCALEPTSRLFTEAQVPTLVLTSERGRAKAGPLKEVADIVVCGEDEVEMEQLVIALSERGLTRVLCEGGPHLMHELVSHDVLDELCLTISPLTVGRDHQHLASGPLQPPRGFPIAAAFEADGSVFLRCRRVRD